MNISSKKGMHAYNLPKDDLSLIMLNNFPLNLQSLKSIYFEVDNAEDESFLFQIIVLINHYWLIHFFLGLPELRHLKESILLSFNFSHLMKHLGRDSGLLFYYYF